MFPDMSKYTGDFKNDMFHGKGTYTWATGDKYIGEWAENMKHGKGSVVWSDGKTYDSDFDKDKDCGNGVFGQISSQIDPC